METQDDQRNDYDGCFSWFVCLCSFVAHAAIAFNVVCFGVLLPDFTAYFEETQSVMGLLGASRIGIVYLSGTLSGGLTQKLGCRAVAMTGFMMAALGSLSSAFVTHLGPLVLMFGVVSGIGTGLCYIPLTVIVKHYFKKRCALAISIATAGMSFGAVTLGSISGVLLRWLSWRGFLVVLACCNIQILLPVAFFFPVQQRKSLNMQVETSLSSHPEDEQLKLQEKLEPGVMRPKKSSRLLALFSIVFDVFLLEIKPFLVLTLSFIFVHIGFTGSYMLGSNRAVVQGVEKLYAGFVVTSVGCMSFFGRILAGFIADLACIDITLQFSGSVFCCACVLFLSTLAGRQLTLHLFFSGLVGLCMGGYEGIHAMLVLRTVGSDRLPKGMAWIQFMRGISNVIALPLTGWLFDISHGYLVPYLMLASFQMCGALAVFATKFMKTATSQDSFHKNKQTLTQRDSKDANLEI